jgi:hypothetical protein
MKKNAVMELLSSLAGTSTSTAPVFARVDESQIFISMLISNTEWTRRKEDEPSLRRWSTRESRASMLEMSLLMVTENQTNRHEKQ